MLSEIEVVEWVYNKKISPKNGLIQNQSKTVIFSQKKAEKSQNEEKWFKMFNENITFF